VAGDVTAVPAAPPGASRFRRALFRVLSALRRALTAPPGSAWRDPVIVSLAVLACGLVTAAAASAQPAKVVQPLNQYLVSGVSPTL